MEVQLAVKPVISCIQISLVQLILWVKAVCRILGQASTRALAGVGEGDKQGLGILEIQCWIPKC